MCKNKPLPCSANNPKDLQLKSQWQTPLGPVSTQQQSCFNGQKGGFTRSGGQLSQCCRLVNTFSRFSYLDTVPTPFFNSPCMQRQCFKWGNQSEIMYITVSVLNQCFSYLKSVAFCLPFTVSVFSELLSSFGMSRKRIYCCKEAIKTLTTHSNLC